MTQPAGDAVADHRVPDGLAHHKTRPGRRLQNVGGHGRVRGERVDDEAAPACPGPATENHAEILTPPQTCGSRQHGAPRSGRSGGQRAAALATAGRQDGPAGAGPHAQAEPVGLRAAAVVRLEGALTLAHCFSCVSRCPCSHQPGRITSPPGVSCGRTAVSGVSYQRVASSRRATTTWARETHPSHTGDLTRVRTPVGRSVSTPSATVRDG